MAGEVFLRSGGRVVALAAANGATGGFLLGMVDS